MTDLKFSLTSQCHKTTILRIIVKKEKSYLAWYHPTPADAGSRRIGVKTAKSDAGYRPH